MNKRQRKKRRRARDVAALQAFWKMLKGDILTRREAMLLGIPKEALPDDKLT